MASIYDDLDTLFKDKKAEIRIILLADTGKKNVSFPMYNMYVPVFIQKHFEMAGVWGILSFPPRDTKISDLLPNLYRGLVHMIANPDIYISGPIDESMLIWNGGNYRQAIQMLGIFISECQNYPNGQIECHF